MSTSGRAAWGPRVLTTGSRAAAFSCPSRDVPCAPTPASRHPRSRRSISLEHTRPFAEQHGGSGLCISSCPSSHLEVSFLPFPGQLLVLLQAPAQGSTPPGSFQWHPSLWLVCFPVSCLLLGDPQTQPLLLIARLCPSTEGTMTGRRKAGQPHADTPCVDAPLEPRPPGSQWTPQWADPSPAIPPGLILKAS